MANFGDLPLEMMMNIVECLEPTHEETIRYHEGGEPVPTDSSIYDLAFAETKARIDALVALSQCNQILRVLAMRNLFKTVPYNTRGARGVRSGSKYRATHEQILVALTLLPLHGHEKIQSLVPGLSMPGGLTVFDVKTMLSLPNLNSVTIRCSDLGSNCAIGFRKFSNAKSLRLLGCSKAQQLTSLLNMFISLEKIQVSTTDELILSQLYTALELHERTLVSLTLTRDAAVTSGPELNTTSNSRPSLCLVRFEALHHLSCDAYFIRGSGFKRFKTLSHVGIFPRGLETFRLHFSEPATRDMDIDVVWWAVDMAYLDTSYFQGLRSIVVSGAGGFCMRARVTTEQELEKSLVRVLQAVRILLTYDLNKTKIIFKIAATHGDHEVLLCTEGVDLEGKRPIVKRAGRAGAGGAGMGDVKQRLG